MTVNQYVAVNKPDPRKCIEEVEKARVADTSMDVVLELARAELARREVERTLFGPARLAESVESQIDKQKSAIMREEFKQAADLLKKLAEFKNELDRPGEHFSYERIVNATCAFLKSLP